MLNSDWLSDSIMNGDWLYFSHVRNAIRKPDWTYRFFTGENIAHIEFYLQGLLPKILAIYTIKINLRISVLFLIRKERMHYCIMFYHLGLTKA